MTAQELKDINSSNINEFIDLSEEKEFNLVFSDIKTKVKGNFEYDEDFEVYIIGKIHSSKPVFEDEITNILDSYMSEDWDIELESIEVVPLKK